MGAIGLTFTHDEQSNPNPNLEPNPNLNPEFISSASKYQENIQGYVKSERWKQAIEIEQSWTEDELSGELNNNSSIES